MGVTQREQGQIPLGVSCPEGLTFMKQQTGAKKTGQWGMKVMVKQVLYSCPEVMGTRMRTGLFALADIDVCLLC